MTYLQLKNKNNFFLYLYYKKKLIYFMILHFLLCKKNTKLFIFIFNFVFFSPFFSFTFFNKKIDLYQIKINYISKWYHLLYRNKTFLNFSFFSNSNSYFFWHYYNRDTYIQLLVNIIMKKGKKFVSYKNIFLFFGFIKKLIGFNPIFILKKSLYKNRLLFDIQKLKLRKKTLVIPKMLSLRGQLSKSIRYIFNNFIFNSLKINVSKNGTIPFYQKLGYFVLNSLFNNDRLEKLIIKESLVVKNNFFHIKRENYLRKYLSEMEGNTILKKSSLFRKKYKSLTKKDKFLKYKKNQFFFYKKKIDLKKKYLFGRFQLNFRSKLKLKSKWF